MTVIELDREYLWERCNILNAFLDEILDFDQAKEQLDRVDFKFETLVDLEMVPILVPAKPFNWDQK